MSLIRQSESSRAAADLAAIRYREGTVDFLVLLDAQRERLAAEDSQAQAEVDLYRGIVAIYKALGGGWQPDTVVVRGGILLALASMPCMLSSCSR